MLRGWDTADSFCLPPQWIMPGSGGIRFCSNSGPHECFMSQVGNPKCRYASVPMQFGRVPLGAISQVPLSIPPLARFEAFRTRAFLHPSICVKLGQGNKTHHFCVYKCGKDGTICRSRWVYSLHGMVNTFSGLKFSLLNIFLEELFVDTVTGFGKLIAHSPSLVVMKCF